MFSIFVLILILFFCFKIIKQLKRKCSLPVRLIYYELIYNSCIKYLIGYLHFPSFLNYVSDLILFLIVLEYISFRVRKKEVKIPKSLFICIFVFFFVTLLSYGLNLYSPILYFWGLRNTFRFFIFGLMCAAFLKSEDLKILPNIIYPLFIINLIVVTYQFFFIEYSGIGIGDYISGLYSNGIGIRGGNTSLTWLMCIVCCFSIAEYLNTKKNVSLMILSIAGSIYIAAIAEIKIFFVDLLFISILSIILSKKTFKSVFYVILACVVLVVGIDMMYKLFPSFANFFSIENILEYVSSESGYAHSGINRLTGFKYVIDNFLMSNTTKLFGIGLGNADFSLSFDLVTSTFYKEHSSIYYYYFLIPFVTLECGIVGVISYIYIYINYLFCAIKIDESFNEEKIVKIVSIAITCISFLTMISNTSLRSESSAYLAIYIMTMPIILKKNKSRDNER